MKRDALRLRDYLAHILLAVDRINEYVADMDELAFISHQMTQDAVIRNLEIMGEASKNVERHFPAYTAQHADLPWEEIYLMRNRVSHGYFSVDLSVVWKTIQRDLPELAQQIRELLIGLDSPAGKE